MRSDEPKGVGYLIGAIVGDYMTIVIIEYQRPLLRIVRRNLVPIVSSPFQAKRLIHSTPITMGISNYASQDGEFRRKASSFRNHVEVGGKYPPEKDRYHLYVSWACPWGTFSSRGC